MISAQDARNALAIGIALIPAGIIQAQESEPSQVERRAPQVLQSLKDDIPDPEQMEQFRRQFEQMQRRLPKDARTFRFNPEGLRVDPGQTDLQLFFQRPGDEDSALGLRLREVPEVLRSHLDLPEGQGVLVSELAEDSPAAGTIEPNDILLSLGDSPLSNPSDLTEALEEAEGGPLQFTLIRKGKRQTSQFDRPRPASEGTTRYRLGVMIEVPDDAIRSQLGLPEGQGVIVMGVTSGSAAEEAGIKTNDILTGIDGEPITGAQELSEQVQGTNGEAVELTLLRDGEEATIEVVPAKFEAAPVATDHPIPPTGYRFFGPGVMIDPETGAIRPGPGQARRFAFPMHSNGELQQAIKEMREQLEQLREEVDALNRSRGRRDDQDR